MHKDGSIYDDIPEAHYQFPNAYLSRAEPLVGDWVVYLEPVREPNSKGFFGVAKVESIVTDPYEADRSRALIEPGSYLPFSPTVPRRIDGELVERDCPNQQWAVRPLSAADFARIIALGLPDEELLPRLGDPEPSSQVEEERIPFQVERPVVRSLVSRPFRDRAFRRAVLDAYGARCAVTGWKLINGGGRAEAEAAHIRPVEHGGPDSIRNGLALSGTAHWMFDRGLIGLSDDLDIVVSRRVNDRPSIDAGIKSSGKALAPTRESERPHPGCRAWDRVAWFKG